ncbi:MAG: sugar transferase [Gemmatimonadetes bacterium]|nr:MAG: sugar transferase [Gemmatimonadota bacterium]
MSAGAETSTLVTGTFPVFETPIAETPSASVEQTRASRIRELLVSERLNRAVNFTIAFIGLVVLSPLILIIAIAVKLTSRGPIVYRQTRVGVDRRRSGGDRRGKGERRTTRRIGEMRARSDAQATSTPVTERRGNNPRGDRRAMGRRGGDRRAVDVGGRAFTMYKFRTMTVNAETEGAVWATKNDTRVTPIGGILRGARLDELPQLVNVLKGDMNIVGPRPERPSIFMQLRKEIDSYQLRQRAKPGITGWAQINQNYDTSIDDVRRKVEYDLAYIERRSVVEDMRIMAKTLPVMIFRKGAH